MKPIEEFIPYAPLFLSPKTTEIDIVFGEDSRMTGEASLISSLPTLCPELESITLSNLIEDPGITDIVSELLLACNHNVLRVLAVDSSLTEEALKVVYQLPKLSKVRTVIQGDTLLPQVVLPNRTSIDIEFDGDLD